MSFIFDQVGVTGNKNEQAQKNKAALASPTVGDTWAEVMASKIITIIKKVPGKKWIVYNYLSKQYEIVTKQQIEFAVQQENGNWTYDMIGSKTLEELKLPDLKTPVDRTHISRYVTFHKTNLVVVSDDSAIDAFYATKEISRPHGLKIADNTPSVIIIGENSAKPIKDFFASPLVDKIIRRLVSITDTDKKSNIYS